MEPLLCPTCGKSNPESSITCQNCGSTLKKVPTQPLPDLLAGLAQLNDDPEEQIPDWLKSLQGNLPEPTPTVQISKDSSDNNPDTTGIENLLDQSLQESGQGFDNTNFDALFDESIEPPSRISESAPDWLNDLKDRAAANSPAQQSEKPSQADVDPAIFSSLPDWLSALTESAQTPAEAASQGTTTGNPLSPETDDSDWLSNLGGDFTQDPSQENEPAQPATEDFSSGWLTETEPTPVAKQDPLQTEAMGDTQQWLANLGGSTDIPVESESIASEAPTQDLSGWLNSLDSPPTQETTAAANLPTQQPGLSSIPEKPAPTSGQAPAEPSTSITFPDDTADWLASLGDTSSVSVTPDGSDWLSGLETPSVATSPADTSPPVETPDWMASLVTATPVPVEETPTDPIPDWMSSLGSTAQIPAGQPTTEDEPQNSPFNWLSEAEDSTPIQQENTSPAPFNASDFSISGVSDTDAGTPDWLANLGAPQQTEQQSAPETPVEAAAPVSSNTSENTSLEEPDWLSSLAQNAWAVELSESPTFDQSTFQDSQVFSDTPATNAGDTLISNPTDNNNNIDSLLSMNTPDWLTGLTPASSEKDSTPVADQLLNQDLRPGELPSWVQAMRPMETVMSSAGETDEVQQIEEQGPLAGLSSVLPSQVIPMDGRPPKTYSTRLTISETQQTQAALLENLLGSETTAQKSTSHHEKSTSRRWRWIISAVLLLSILLVSALRTQIFPAPASPSAGAVREFYDTAVGLPENSVVLIVVDYQPGFAGEMETILAPVLDQLVSKKTRLAFVTSSPLGSLLAERLATKYAQPQAYQAGSQYINLGYLPGGSSGIKAFAEHPEQTVGSDATDGNLWAQPALEGVTLNKETRLSNFSAMIIATDNPDTGRVWIEQSQPQLGTRPLLMLVSAQAKVMIQPYYHSRQVRGMIAGLEDGMLYETALGKPGPARAYWDAYGIGMIVAELFILIGGIWGLITGLRARRATAEQEEA